MASAKADRQRVNVMAGPVLADGDLAYRGTRIPVSYWKVIAYATEDTLAARAFLLTQNLDGLERITLDQFAVYEVTLDDLSDRTGVVFDLALVDAQTQIAPAAAPNLPRRLRTVSDVRW